MSQDLKSRGTFFSIAALVGASFGAALLNSYQGEGRGKRSGGRDEQKDEPKIQGKLISSLEGVESIDAILVLGGGRPIKRSLPPPWVTSRCDLAAEAHKKLNLPPILTLSAGTAHADQLLNDRGLPVWESEASALYLISNHEMPTEKIFMETSSYDTIGSAYFARTSFCQVFGWKKLLIITSQFHMSRSRAVFDWVFNAPSTEGAVNPGYELMYLESPNTGLGEEILNARLEREEIGRKRVESQERKYDTLLKILKFLTTEHGMYKVPSEYLSTITLETPDALRYLPRDTVSTTATVSSCRSLASDISDLVKQSYAVICQESEDSVSKTEDDENPPSDVSPPAIIEYPSEPTDNHNSFQKIEE